MYRNSDVQPGRTLAAVAVVQFAVSLDLSVVNVGLPQIGAGLGVGAAALAPAALLVAAVLIVLIARTVLPRTAPRPDEIAGATTTWDPPAARTAGAEGAPS